MDADGVVCDEPVIHRISYTVNPEGDDFGLVERLIDLMRTIDDTWNKILEYKNRGLMPRRSSPGASTRRPTTCPGGTDWYTIDPLNPTAKPEWENPIKVPQELFQILELAIEQMRALAADVDVQPDPRLTSQTAKVAVQQAQTRWDSFLGDAEEFDSRLMRHCLCLVARYYTEERIIKIRGANGWEPPIAFIGADLRSQVDVRVMEGSLRTKSRAQTMDDIAFMQAELPGRPQPEAVWAACTAGAAESLLRTWQLDVAYANDVVRPARGRAAARRRSGGGRTWTSATRPSGTWCRLDAAEGRQRRDLEEGLRGRDEGRPSKPCRLRRSTCSTLVFDALEAQEQQRKMQMAMSEQARRCSWAARTRHVPQLPIPMPSQGAPLSRREASPTATTPKQ
jgi:hypothetical protein